MEKLDQEATAISSRDSSFQLDPTKLQPDNLFIGNKALIFVYADNFNVYENLVDYQKFSSLKKKSQAN